jgi:hypothetical protein
VRGSERLHFGWHVPSVRGPRFVSRNRFAFYSPIISQAEVSLFAVPACPVPLEQSCLTSSRPAKREFTTEATESTEKGLSVRHRGLLWVRSFLVAATGGAGSCLPPKPH